MDYTNPREALQLKVENCQLKRQLIEIQTMYLGLQLKNVDADLERARAELAGFEKQMEEALTN